MTILKDNNWRSIFKVLPFIISLAFTIVVYIILENFHPTVGIVTTAVISVSWA